MIEVSVVDAKGFVYELVRGPKRKIDDGAVEFEVEREFLTGNAQNRLISVYAH